VFVGFSLMDGDVPPAVIEGGAGWRGTGVCR
jgi:hypothetical protein